MQSDPSSGEPCAGVAEDQVSNAWNLATMDGRITCILVKRPQNWKMQSRNFPIKCKPIAFSILLVLSYLISLNTTLLLHPFDSVSFLRESSRLNF